MIFPKLKIMEFERAAVKLSAFYVLIVMVISISFSVSLYNISTRELGRGVGKTFRIVSQCSPELLPPGFKNLEHVRIEQIKEFNSNIKEKLYYFNLIILVIASGLSYFLAKKTLHPLEQAMESQNRFTADASHELRTPLTAMRAEIEVAMRDKNITLAQTKKLMESNIEEIAKLENLTNTLLKLARLDEVENDFSKLDLSQIVIEAFEKVQSLALNKKIIFKNSLDPATIVGDKESLVELFVILIDNAIKYSHKGGKIFISIVKTGNSTEIKIKDEGVGIKESQLPHIFDRFYRADSSRTKEKIDGYGLGLSLAKQIVDLHNAKIRVKSVVNKGSEFTVVLPQK